MTYDDWKLMSPWEEWELEDRQEAREVRRWENADIDRELMLCDDTETKN